MNYILIFSSEIMVPFIFVLIGIGISFSAILILLKAKRTLYWSSTTGFVKSSEVTISQNSKGASRYRPEICYSYTVHGNEYVSNRIESMDGFLSSVKAYKKTSQYPKGSQILIFYNPDKPADSVIEPGVKPDYYYFLAFGIIWLSISVIILAS